MFLARKHANRRYICEKNHQLRNVACERFFATNWLNMSLIVRRGLFAHRRIESNMCFFYEKGYFSRTNRTVQTTELVWKRQVRPCRILFTMKIVIQSRYCNLLTFYFAFPHRLPDCVCTPNSEFGFVIHAAFPH